MLLQYGTADLYLLSELAKRIASNSGLGSPSAKSDVEVQTQALSLPQLGFSSI